MLSEIDKADEKDNDWTWFHLNMSQTNEINSDQERIVQLNLISFEQSKLPKSM